MHKATNDSRRKPRTSHFTEIAKSRSINRTELIHGSIDPSMQCSHNPRDIFCRQLIAFTSERFARLRVPGF